MDSYFVPLSNLLGLQTHLNEEMRAWRKFGVRPNSDSFAFSHETPLFGVNEQWILIKSCQLYQWNMLL